MSRLRIGIDVRAASRGRGVGVYVRNLIRALIDMNSGHELVLYSDQKHLPDWPPPLMRRLGPRPFPIWEQLTIPLATRSDRLDVMHYPVNTGPIVSNVRSVVTVHDVMFLASRHELPLSPSMYQTLGRYYRRLVSPQAIRRARVIMTVSDHTRQDLVRHFPETSVKSVVVHLAPDPSAKRAPAAAARDVLVRLGLNPEDRFVLILGGVDPRKNTERCIEAFAQFSRSDASSHRLVVTGVNPQLASLLRKWSEAAGVVDLVAPLPFVSDSDLIALYSSADVVLYPSLYEGFGLPVLEAMACGSPVIASTRGSVPEVAGGAAILIDPTDVRAMAEKLLAVISDYEFRRRLVGAGYARAQEFSWSKTASQTIDAYERAAGE